MNSEIKNIYSKDLVSIRENASLSDADDKMNNYNIRHLPVIDDTGTLVGIISKSDYIALKHVDSRLAQLQVKNFMSSQVKVMGKATKIKDVAKLFINKKINSVLVIENREIIGIVTSEDLIRLLASDAYAEVPASMDLSSLAEEGWFSVSAAQLNS